MSVFRPGRDTQMVSEERRSSGRDRWGGKVCSFANLFYWRWTGVEVGVIYNTTYYI